MPEPRLQRARQTLPDGYQFGQAGGGARVILLEADEFIVGTLPPNTTTHTIRDAEWWRHHSGDGR